MGQDLTATFDGQPNGDALAIAFLVRDFIGGGAKRDTVLLANALAAQGHRVTLLVLNREGPLGALIAPGLAIHEIGASKLRSAWRALDRAVRVVRPDVLVSSEAAQNLLAMVATRTLPVATRPRLVLREVGSPSAALRNDAHLQNRLAYRLIGPVYRRADLVLTLTEGAREDLAANFGVPRARIHVVGSNAVISPEDARRLDAWDGETGREPGLVVSVGRLSPEKDHATLLRSLALLPKSLGVRLAIVGSGALNDQLHDLAASLGIADRVSLPGYADDPLAWIMRAHVAVTSSVYEGFGNAIVEALACGTPVVATDCPYGPREILAAGAFGRLVPVGNAQALADAIAATLAAPFDRASLRARALRHRSDRAATDFIAAMKPLTRTASPLVGDRHMAPQA